MGLLPADLLFVVSVSDPDGRIVESTRSVTGQRAIDPDTLRTLRSSNDLVIGRLPRGPTAEGSLDFSRRLNTPDGGFAGVVRVAVDANYFVSGYDTERMGEHGVLGLLGADGVFRVRRTGEVVFSGDAINLRLASVRR